MIYSREEIGKAKKPSFDIGYDYKYNGRIWSL
jgi:hypothetical protein